MGELGHVRVQVPAVERLQRLADLAMQAQAPRGRQLLVECVPDQDV